jgi:hypothetical protein
MSIIVDAARLITNLGSLGSNFVGVDSPNFVGVDSLNCSGEYAAASATSMVGDLGGAAASAGRMMFPRALELNARGLTGWARASAAKQPALTSEGSLILTTLSAVELLELTTGFGQPSEGADLRVGADQFTSVARQLESALPNDSWQGSASEAYAGRVTAMQDLAKTMAELDLELAEIVKNQAEWVTHVRLGLGILKDLLLAAFAIYWAIMLTVPTPGNFATAKTFEIAVCVLGIAAAVGMLSTLIYFSVENRKKADALTAQYADVAAAAAAVVTDTLTRAEGPGPAEESTVSSFEAISSDMSGTSAFAGMPTIANLSRLASAQGASADDLADFSALTDDTPADGLPQVPETPAFTPPPVNIAGQMMGSMQRLAVTPRQGRGAATPAEEAPAEAAIVEREVEGVGAASGTEGAGPAPIDVATRGWLQPSAA